MSHVLHTVFVSYNRLELLKESVFSYRETVTLPHELVIVDNASDDETRRWIRNSSLPYHFLDQNYYPGYATNRGFELASPEATLMHRSDNDMKYLPGWCDEIVERFENPELGQLGLRTVDEEGGRGNVGGNCVIRREVYDSGARYDERPWTECPWEDGAMTVSVRVLRYAVARVQRPCTVHIGIASSQDPYYQQTFADRNITFAEWGVA